MHARMRACQARVLGRKGVARLRARAHACMCDVHACGCARAPLQAPASALPPPHPHPTPPPLRPPPPHHHHPPTHHAPTPTHTPHPNPPTHPHHHPHTSLACPLLPAPGCDAVFPGYGFLSENTEFSAMCEDNGIAFLGPTAGEHAGRVPAPRKRKGIVMVAGQGRAAPHRRLATLGSQPHASLSRPSLPCLVPPRPPPQRRWACLPRSTPPASWRSAQRCPC